MAVEDGVITLGSKEVPWFPTRMEDFDSIGNKTLVLGDGILDVDHPSFRDPEYRKRRLMIGELGMQYKMHEPIPYLKYLETENQTWSHCYNNLRSLYPKYACKEYNESIQEFERELGFKHTEVP